jgi:DNA-binding NarL/FixJ family response regulator
MAEPIAVSVHAPDPISKAGIVAQLKERPEVRIVSDHEQPVVTIVVAEEIDDESLRSMRAVQRSHCERIVLVLARVDDAGLVRAVEAGARALLRRSEAGAASLTAAVRAAANGDGTVPPDLLGRLLAQVGRLQQQVLAPRGLTFSGLSEREIAVLQLVADGMDTGEIATKLCYSERTIKNVIHDVTTRLNLRNRSQAVAYALREGWI